MFGQRATISKYFDSKSEMREFGKWATGSSSSFFVETPKLWNQIHGDKFTLEPNARTDDTLPTMILLWKASR